jgi:flagellar hook-associated protein 2
MATNGVSTLGNRTFLFGGASGIDTSALISAAYNQRMVEATRIADRIETNNSRKSALSEMQTLAQNVQTTLNGIRANYSLLNTSSSQFDGRTGSLSANTSTDPTRLVNVAIANGTQLGSYEIEVMNKAKNLRVGSGLSTTNQNADLGFNGTFDIGQAGNTAATINVTADMSLSELASAINAQRSTTGVSASVVQVSSSSFQLILSAVDTNKEISIGNVTGDDVLENIGMTSGGTFANIIQPAEAAMIRLDGLTITRDTNNFNDLITGMDLTIKNAEPGTIISINIENDNSSIKAAIEDFITAYNTMRDFIVKQQQVTSGGELSKEAILFGDNMLKGLAAGMQSSLAGSYGTGVTGNLSTLRDIGITIDASSRLVMDSAKFDTALIEKFDQVRALFQSSGTSDNASFRVTGNTSKLPGSSFALDIVMSGDTISSVSVGGDDSMFTVSGRTIRGNVGTPYAGMTFGYVGTGDATVNVQIYQGFSDVMHANINDYADILTGMVQKEKQKIDEQNTTMETRAARVKERADEYRENLITKYGKMEAAMSRSQTTLAQLRALLGIKDKD